MIAAPAFRHGFLRRGFTLLELAIVLLIISFVVGGIWVAVENSWNHYRVYRANQQIIKTVQNIREYYMSCVQLPPGNCNSTNVVVGGDETAIFDAANLFPIEMRRNPAGGPPFAIDHPFNNSNVNEATGSFHVWTLPCPNNPGGPLTCFRIKLSGMQEEPCIQLLESVPITDGELGILQVGAGQGAPAWIAGAQPMPAGSSTLNMSTPVLASVAQRWCNSGVPNNEVDWDFKLRN